MQQQAGMAPCWGERTCPAVAACERFVAPQADLHRREANGIPRLTMAGTISLAAARVPAAIETAISEILGLLPP